MNSPEREYPEIPGQVYLYGTCLVDLFYPEAGMDALALLESAGIGVSYPQAQTCCGQPAYTSGYELPAASVAKSQIELFPEPWPVIVLSGSCAGMMRFHYPRLFKNDPLWQKKAQALSERVFEFTEFLVHVVDLQPFDAGLPEQITLHTSCAARREMQVHQSGAALVDRCRQTERLVHNHEAECCGFGGTFSVRYPEISGAIVTDKVDALIATGASKVVSADCGCLMNITGAAKHQGKLLEGEHIASWLRRRMATK